MKSGIAIQIQTCPRDGCGVHWDDEVEKRVEEARRPVEKMTQSVLSKAFRGDLTVDFREAVRNWKNLGPEDRKRYLFVLSENEQEKALSSDTFPMEPANYLLQRIRKDRAKRREEVRTRKTSGGKEQTE